MRSFAPFFSIVLLAASILAASNVGVTVLDEVDPSYSSAPYTDMEHIQYTLSQVNQKGGPAVDEYPNMPVSSTVVTALDGNLDASANVPSVRRTAWSRHARSQKHRYCNNKRSWAKRANPGYVQVFNDTGTSPHDRDASIEGTAYLTYTVVPNATYAIDECLEACDRVSGCVFANLYYEYNNDLLNHISSAKSNLKCALYADIHTAEEKTNWGGQQSQLAPASLTYIQQSTGWAAKPLADPESPDGYELVFGPTNGANNAPGYMGFAFLDKYDVNACATLCNNRDPDPQGGHCKYVNIWRALVNGNPTTYTCSMYFFPADSSTAINYGQGDLKVTWSRGYRKRNTA